MAFDSDHDRDSDNLSSTIRLSLQHIGKADINILPQQQQALSFVLSGRDTVVNLSTGFGKSVVFKLTPLCFDLKRRQPLWSSRVVIVSPLISLMESQVKDIQHRGLKAVRLSAETELSQAVTDATHIFLSPEAMCESKWIDIFRQQLRRRFAICTYYYATQGINTVDQHLGQDDLIG